MVEFAPNQIIKLKFRSEKEMRVSFRKIRPDTGCCPSVYFLAFSLSVPAKIGFRLR